ncbi:potassium-transporting ATPase subunit KdpC [Lachnoclostridium sp. An181]|uniref:potassium-transporting ATPase subunit KdpC n=1 Tax=Lachnoclostridium sp. An181 TaxID=1965575 RepID=UPI000B3A6140|nr:potassium-transporting ATPase subunit KdpC [Lachnoclostridium sp. An181]OUP51287.1 potassium-transporting ATPase subunit C [Lachnoclostridium sp. An181]
MKNFASYLKRALILTLILLLCCSVIYPLALTGLGQLLFPKQANGNLIEVDGKAVGSELVGQDFTGDQYFQGRISSVNYNTYTEEEKEDGTYGGVSSGSFNYAPTNEDLKARVEEDVAKFKERYKEATGDEFTGEIPADLLTASGSGLDPHISPKSAEIQIPIIVSNSGLTEEQVNEIIKENTEHKILGIFGEEKVNVLKCNIAIAKAMGEI